MAAVRNRSGLLVRLVGRCDTAAAMRPCRHVPFRLPRLLLVATFLVDFTCFENNAGGGVLLDVPFDT